MSVHSHAAAQKSSGAFFSVWDRERSQKSAGRGRNAFRPSEKVRATDVMLSWKHIAQYYHAEFILISIL